MSENQEMLINTIQCRIAWYEKAIAMLRGVISWENGFDWPPSSNGIYEPMPITEKISSISEWNASIHELKNCLNMLKSYTL